VHVEEAGVNTSTSNHHPKVEHHEEHLINTQQTGVLDAMNFTVLPHTDVPQYLLETPLQEQDRHLDSFHRNQPQANQGGDGFLGLNRPGLGDNLELITRNLADAEYFDILWRAPFDRRITSGDGTPDTVVRQ
jgi:hypothetical protein